MHDIISLSGRLERMHIMIDSLDSILENIDLFVVYVLLFNSLSV